MDSNPRKTKFLIFITFLHSISANKCNFTIERGKPFNSLDSKRVEFNLKSKWYFDSVNNGYIIKPFDTNFTKVKIEDYYRVVFLK